MPEIIVDKNFFKTPENLRKNNINYREKNNLKTMIVPEIFYYFIKNISSNKNLTFKEVLILITDYLKINYKK